MRPSIVMNPELQNAVAQPMRIWGSHPATKLQRVYLWVARAGPSNHMPPQIITALLPNAGGCSRQKNILLSVSKLSHIWQQWAAWICSHLWSDGKCALSHWAVQRCRWAQAHLRTSGSPGVCSWHSGQKHAREWPYLFIYFNIFNYWII